MTALENAVAKTKKLFAERTSSEDWSNNIIEGSQGLTEKKDWDAYIMFLANPNGSSKTGTIVPLEVEDEKQEHPEVENGMVETRYENGTDMFVHVHHKKSECNKEN